MCDRIEEVPYLHGSEASFITAIVIEMQQQSCK